MYQQPPNSPSQPGQPQWTGQPYTGQPYPGQQPYPEQPYPGQQPPLYPQQQQPYGTPPPNWQPAPPPKKKSKLPLIIGVIVLVVAVIACASIANAISHGANTGTASSNNSSSSTDTSPATTSAPANQHFKVGEAVTVGNTWNITVASAKTSHGSDIYKPQKAGNMYLIIIVSMKNISATEQDASSLLQWNLSDSTGQKYDETIYPDAGASPDGKVEAGAPLKGALVYEVPGNMKSFTLGFENDITSAGQTIWDITV